MKMSERDFLNHSFCNKNKRYVIDCKYCVFYVNTETCFHYSIILLFSDLSIIGGYYGK